MGVLIWGYLVKITLVNVSCWLLAELLSLLESRRHVKEGEIHESTCHLDVA